MGVYAGFIALPVKGVEVVSLGLLGRGAVPLRLPSAVDLVLVAEGRAELGQKVAGMAEQNESSVWGLMLQGLMWWLGCRLHSWGVGFLSLWRCYLLGRID